MINTYKQLGQNFKNKIFHQVYFLYGEEPYYIDNISRYLESKILNESEKDFNQHIFYGKEANISSILDVAMKYPMLAQYNVIVIREAQEMKDIKEFLPYFQNPNPQTLLVVCYKYKSLDKRQKLYKYLKDSKHAIVFESKAKYESEIPAWISGYVKGKGYEIDAKARFALQEFVGNELSKLSREIDKLTEIKGNDQYIVFSDVEKNIGASKEYNVFELQKALGEKNTDRLARIINTIKGNPRAIAIQALIPSLFNYFSKLMVLSYSKTFDNSYQKLGLPGFFKQEYRQAMNNYKGKFEIIIGLLKEYDLRSKGVGDLNTPSEELCRELLTRIVNL